MWEISEIGRIYRQPLLALVEQAHETHIRHHAKAEVQLCHLLSIKTGGCPEDCAYCPQSARYSTEVEAGKLLPNDEVLNAAKRAKEGGSTRFCMGAAWRQVKEGPEFDRVLDMVSGVASLGLEVCCTLGMLTANQAQKLAAAGLTAYNHNLDTSPEFYGQIITTRTYEDRLQTLENVRSAGISVCCGGILGMGEGENDRIRLLATLANLNPPPESVPINALVPVAGTPLAERPALNAFEFVRAIATARIVMPTTKVRLSAGRLGLSDEAQALCFYAGANSIFVGDRLLTTPNPDLDHDHELLAMLGLNREPSHTPVTSAPLEQACAAELARLEERGLRRRLLPPESGEDFCSNDYLGLSTHPAIRAALAEAIAAGVPHGSTGSRLVSGNHPQCELLESEFAIWRGAERALLYSSGYAASVGVLTGLIRAQDIAFSDALNHASLIDGLRLTGCRKVVVPHLDLNGLETAFRRQPASGDQRRFFVVESLFSMDGDRAPLAELVDLCRRHGVSLIVDEAHATGIYPGVSAPDVIVATLHPCGKALGASGALVAASSVVCDYLVNHSRSFIYSTAPSPLLAVQLRAALRVLRQEPELAQRVRQLASHARQKLREHGLRALGAEDSPILPVIVGDDRLAVEVAGELRRDGFEVRAIRAPTVPQGSARLRLTVHSRQSEAVIDRLAAQFGHCMLEATQPA
ncbi:MAG TPA: biotin synthase BioB [Terriglobales bacterium]|nr:biotin synthase BioB [Terriglobales bacterium]